MSPNLPQSRTSQLLKQTPISSKTCLSTPNLTPVKDQIHHSRLEDRPQEIVLEILEKIPVSALDISNLFSILENCSLLEPTYATPFSNILPSQLPKEGKNILNLLEKS